MNYFKYLSLTFIMLPLTAMALKGGPKPPPAVRPTPFPKITCATIKAELQKLKGMSSESNQAIAGFMDEVVVTIDAWHRELVNYEGKTFAVKVGEFAPMKQQSEDVGATQAMVWDTLNIVDARFDEMLEVLPSCLKMSN